MNILRSGATCLVATGVRPPAHGQQRQPLRPRAAHLSGGAGIGGDMRGCGGRGGYSGGQQSAPIALKTSVNMASH